MRRVVLAAVALLAFAVVAPAAAQAERLITVDPTTDLNALGDTVEVSGSGYVPAEHPNGFYVAQIAIVDDGGTDVVRFGNARLVHPNPTSPTQVKLEEDGSFVADLAVTGTFTQGSNPSINCAVTQCGVATWQGRTNPLPPGSTPGPNQSVIYNDVDIDFVPAVAAAQFSALDRAGQTVTVDGAGYNPAGDGIYVAQTAIVEGEVIFGDAQWVRIDGPTDDMKFGADGTFSTTLDLAATIGEGEDAVDCTVVQCNVSTWTAKTLPLPPGTVPGPPPPPTSPISATSEIHFNIPVTVTPGTLPDTGPATVTVSGQVPPALSGPGIYVMFGAWAYPFWASQDDFPQSIFVPAAQIQPDGSFTAQIEVSPTFALEGAAPVDCKAVQCGIFTMRAHQFSQTDRRLDSFTPVNFVTPPPTPKPEPKPEPQPKPEPKPEPRTKTAKLVVFKKAQKVSRKRIARVARLVCVSDRRCRVVTTKRARVRIGKRSFRAKVLAPKRIAAGKRALVRIKLTKAARRALARRGAGRARLKLRVTSPGSVRTVRTVRVKLR